MPRLLGKLYNLIHGGDGATAVEYAVLISFLLLVSISTVNSLGAALTRPLRRSAEGIVAGDSASSMPRDSIHRATSAATPIRIKRHERTKN